MKALDVAVKALEQYADGRTWPHIAKEALAEIEQIVDEAHGGANSDLTIAILFEGNEVVLRQNRDQVVVRKHHLPDVRERFEAACHMLGLDG